MVENGWFYASFIDPVLTKMRIRAARAVPPGKKILDVACGTGAQVFEFAKKAELAAGIDISESMIKKADSTKKKTNAVNTFFVTGSALDLSQFEDNEFDISTISLALHQFAPDEYNTILSEMKRVSGQIIILDYAIPLPANIMGYGSRIAEFFAGREHYRNFRKYSRLGGLNFILKENNLVIKHTEFFAKGAFILVVCSHSGS